MSEDRFQRVEAVFNAAIEMPADERGSYLAGVAEDVREEVQRLLGHAEGRTKRDRDSGRDVFVPGLHGPDGAAGSPADLVGATIGRYRIVAPLGEGGFGLVYLAEQQVPLRREVALKVIRLGMDTREVIERFEQERQALALMSHPNIATVLDAGATETGLPYFVMELARGHPITDYCDAQRRTTGQRLLLFADVCRAVHHAHQKGVIHRDLKPSNIIVIDEHGRAIPKVIDFGIAKATGLDPSGPAHAVHSTVIGTPQYMSPEQAAGGAGAADIDTRTDVFSLGVLLYELLTGSTPIEGVVVRDRTHDELRRLITEQSPPAPSTRISALMKPPATASADRTSAARIAEQRRTSPANLVRTLREDLDRIVLKALARDREQRYDSAAELADAPATPTAHTEPATSPSPASYLWAVLLARIYACFPLVCPRCGTEMTLIAFITEPAAVSSILEHLGLPTEPPQVAPARAARHTPTTPSTRRRCSIPPPPTPTRGSNSTSE